MSEYLLPNAGHDLGGQGGFVTGDVGVGLALAEVLAVAGVVSPVGAERLEALAEQLRAQALKSFPWLWT